MNIGRAAQQQLNETIFPFWLSRGIDHQHGGFFTCFDNRGATLLSTQKFTWSQGRFVWILARAARLAEHGLLDLGADRMLDAARRGAEFLLEHAVGPDGTCAYVLDKRGAPAPEHVGDRSVYADCFVAMGLAELSRQTGEPEWLAAAEPIIERATADVTAGSAPTAPYRVPAKFIAFGPQMILLNTRLNQVQALRALSRPWQGEGVALGQARKDVVAHRQPNGTFAEMVRRDGSLGQSLLETHRTPGHALESIWMDVEAAELLGDEPDYHGWVGSATALCESAWDAEHGGLYRYVAAEGGEPSGTGTGAYENLIRSTWSTKLWWVHSEAAYTTGLLADRSGDARMAGWFNCIWDYTLNTFPADGDGDEWIQIRDRQGRPFDQVVALPVKDPYHATRNLMQLLELNANGEDKDR